MDKEKSRLLGYGNWSLLHLLFIYCHQSIAIPRPPVQIPSCALTRGVLSFISLFKKKIKMWRLSFFIDRISKVCVLHKLYQEFVQYATSIITFTKTFFSFCFIYLLLGLSFCTAAFCPGITPGVAVRLLIFCSACFSNSFVSCRFCLVLDNS